MSNKQFSLFKYPGGKATHLNAMSSHLETLGRGKKVIAEPFCGTAAVTFYMLSTRQADEYWINDVDPDIYDVLRAVRNAPSALIRKVTSYVPDVEDFYRFKEEGRVDSALENAFRKIFLHQTSHSGLGALSGGARGGRDQTGSHSFTSRWSPQVIASKIENLSALLNSCSGKITNLDWSKVIDDMLSSGAAYLDPPYMNRGDSQFYRFDTIDHRALSACLKTTSSRNWLLSYDDSPVVHDQYDWAQRTTVGTRSGMNHEGSAFVLISPAA